MNHNDRSSDNWYPGNDSEVLSVDPDIYFDEIEDREKDPMARLLWHLINMRIDQWKLIRYRILTPGASLQEIADQEGEVKSHIFKRIRELCEDHQPFKSLFKHYNIEE